MYDSRDGKSYKTVKIGDQVWMAENLAFEPSSGIYWVYNNDKTNVPKYGYLYWETALEVCPTAWHLPTDSEWTVLEDYLGGYELAGQKMKSTSGSLDGDVINESGFNALPGGMKTYYGFQALVTTLDGRILQRTIH